MTGPLIKTLTLRLLTPADWQPLLDFETCNRAWFEQHVAARGEAFYCRAGIEQHIADYLDAYAQGCWFPGLLLDEAGAIIGRVNLKDMDRQAGVAELGYRVGQEQVGKGVASAAVQQTKRLALEQLGLQRLDAVVSPANLASSRVLEKCGFVRVDAAPAASQASGDRALLSYRCQLA